MSTPVNSTGPFPPSGSSNPVGPYAGFKGWFTSIIDWIKGLSPAGATVYDTGWIAMPAETGWTVTGAYRRVGKTVTVQVDMQRSGAGITATTVTLTSLPGISGGRGSFDSVLNQQSGQVILAQIPATGGLILVGVTAATNQRIRGTLTWVAD